MAIRLILDRTWSDGTTILLFTGEVTEFFYEARKHLHATLDLHDYNMSHINRDVANKLLKFSGSTETIDYGSALLINFRHDGDATLLKLALGQADHAW